MVVDDRQEAARRDPTASSAVVADDDAVVVPPRRDDGGRRVETIAGGYNPSRGNVRGDLRHLVGPGRGGGCRRGGASSGPVVAAVPHRPRGRRAPRSGSMMTADDDAGIVHHRRHGAGSGAGEERLDHGGTVVQRPGPYLHVAHGTGAVVPFVFGGRRRLWWKSSSFFFGDGLLVLRR